MTKKNSTVEKEYIIKRVEHGGVKSLVKKALKKGIKVEIFIKHPLLLKFSYRGRMVFVQDDTIPLERMMGDMTRNKHKTNMILDCIGLKTPRGFVTGSYSKALELIRKKNLKHPLLIKPLTSTRAKGVTWDINSRSDFKKAIKFVRKTESFKKLKNFLVEEMFVGSEYRILLMNKEIISCIEKRPAGVTGDGKSTIEELVEKFNEKRLRGFEIKIDKAVKDVLRKNKLNFNSILPKDFFLKFRNITLMAYGGRSINCTHKMSKYFKDICKRAIEILGLTYGGIDLMTKDISAKKGKYVILEVNPNPFYNMHEKPLVEGRNVDVSLKILKHLFPKL